MNIYFRMGAVVKSLLWLSAEIWGCKPAVSRPRRIDPEPSQIDEHLGLQEFPRRHRQRALRAFGASEERSDAMRHGPDMERNHQGWRAGRRRHRRADGVSGAAQYGESAFAGFSQRRTRSGRNASFKHCRVEGRLSASEFEIGLAEPIQRDEGVGAPGIPGARQGGLELLEAAQRHTRHQLVAVAEMPIGRRRADPGKAGGFGESEAGCPLGRDQLERCADQRLAQVAVMITARRIGLAGLVFPPTHVKSPYIMAVKVSMLLGPASGRRRRERLNAG